MISDEEKKYKIKQIKKYQNDMNDEKKIIAGEVMYTGLMSAMYLLFNTQFFSIPGSNIITSGVTTLIGLSGILPGALMTISSICKKIGLENRIDEIKDQLRHSCFEENSDVKIVVDNESEGKGMAK